MSLPQTDSQGRIYVASPGIPVTWNAGVGYTASGQMCISTTVGATDTYVNGWRLDATGVVIVAAQSGSIVSNGGLPFNNSDGTMARQVDVVPSADDPYVNGIRVGALGGVYMTTAAVPVAGNAPVSIVRPELTGINTLGSTLTCSQGTWTGDPTITYAYQWYQGNTPLIGQTATTHIITAGDISSALFCRVTASNSSGGTDAFSNLVIAGAATYNYRNTTDQFPLPGYIYHNSPSLNLRISNVDASSVSRSAIGQLKAGDAITIGSQTGTLANAPTANSDHFIVSMVSWPQLADGTYVATINLV
jgi:hypothetical protein